MIIRKFEARVKKTMGQVVDVPIQIELAYDEENDPLSVQMILTAPDEEDVVWLFSRDLLHRGVNAFTPVGDGDIRFRYLGAIYAQTMVCLRNATGHADITLPHKEVAAFVESTIAAVPMGGEELDGHIDELLEEIFNS